MDLASFLEALPAAQLDSVYASQVRHRHSRVPSQMRHDALHRRQPRAWLALTAPASSDELTGRSHSKASGQRDPWYSITAAAVVFLCETLSSLTAMNLTHALRPPCSGRAARCCARCRRSRSCTWRACCCPPPPCPEVQTAAAVPVSELTAAPQQQSC